MYGFKFTSCRSNEYESGIDFLIWPLERDQNNSSNYGNICLNEEEYRLGEEGLKWKSFSLGLDNFDFV